MEPWAERIEAVLREGRARGLTKTGLAKACGKAQPSISQWFNDNDSKPATQMIMADNLIAAARYLGVTPEWIMTGADWFNRSAEASQPVRIEVSKITETAKILGRLFERRGARFDIEEDADIFSEVYALLDQMPSNPSQDATVEFTATVIDLVAKRLERGDGRRSGRPDRELAGKQTGRKAGAA